MLSVQQQYGLLILLDWSLDGLGSFELSQIRVESKLHVEGALTVGLVEHSIQKRIGEKVIIISK